MENVIYADQVNVQSSLPANNGLASIEEILLISKQIWKKVIAADLKSEINQSHEKNQEKEDKLLEILQIEYKDFSQSFPLVLRWMVQMRQFKVSIFEKYLKKFSAAKVSNREEFLDLQAEYLVMMYRYKNSHIEEHKVQEYRKNIIQSLIDEDKMFKEIQKEVEAQMKLEDNAINEERKKKIYTQLMNLKIANENN